MKTCIQVTHVNHTFAIDSYSQQLNLTVDALLAKLQNFNWPEASLTLLTNDQDIQLSIEHGFFSYNIFSL